MSSITYGQNIIRIVVRDSESKQALPGVVAQVNNLQASSSETGLIEFNNLPDGQYIILFKSHNYEERRETVLLPAITQDTLNIFLHLRERELEEIIISSTRSSRTISDIPTRIELIAGEELDEKGNMKPGDIRMILNESTGIQTQQTSAISANASIRIQGLDGRYTQILKDGFPLFSGAAGGLGLLQTPPLDLKQVEVIKGSASTLYGGGAIAGLVNLISKTPGETRDLNIHLNGTSAGGLDINAFYAERAGKTGITVFAARNSNKPYAPDNGNLTAIPKFERFILNPKFFLSFNENTSLNIGINTSFENRTGGDINYFEDNRNASLYFEKNKTDRLSSQFLFSHKTKGKGLINVKNSISYFNRSITLPGYTFDGTQHATFTEATYAVQNEKVEWVAGMNLWTDIFRENNKTASLKNYDQTSTGLFIQNNAHITDWLELETGLRADYVFDYGISLLPRFSAMFHINDKFNSRLGGGLGYKTPSIFTEESERIQFRNVITPDPENTRLERSYGANWDFNYRRLLFNEQVSFSINHLFFYTYLNNPVVMFTEDGNQYKFKNLSGFIDTKGMETNAKLSYNDFKLFIGYTLTDTRIHNNGVSVGNPLTARHRLNNVLMYEVEDEWKLGGEAYYYSEQRLTDGRRGKPYWILGFMAEKLWEDFSLYINFENFTDTRQTRFDSIYTGNISSPVFRDIYAPLDGFVINGGIKIRL